MPYMLSPVKYVVLMGYQVLYFYDTFSNKV